MSHEHCQGCVAILVSPSGELSLVCKHTREALTHSLPLRVVKLRYSHKAPEHSFAHLKVDAPVPVICDAGESFEIHGSVLKPVSCDCEVTPAVDHPE